MLYGIYNSTGDTSTTSGTGSLVGLNTAPTGLRTPAQAGVPGGTPVWIHAYKSDNSIWEDFESIASRNSDGTYTYSRGALQGSSNADNSRVTFDGTTTNIILTVSAEALAILSTIFNTGLVSRTAIDPAIMDVIDRADEAMDEFEPEDINEGLNKVINSNLVETPTPIGANGQGVVMQNGAIVWGGAGIKVTIFKGGTNGLSTNFYKDPNSVTYEAYLYGAGGPGGSGRKGTNITVSTGGGGGGGGQVVSWCGLSQNLSTSEPVVLCKVLTGGASVSVNSTPGNDGTNTGTNSSFAGIAAAPGNQGMGGGNGAGSGGGGVVTTNGFNFYSSVGQSSGAGGSSSTTGLLGNNATATTNWQPPGGGSGGGLTSGNLQSNGGAGGAVTSPGSGQTLITAAIAGTTAGVAPGAGGSGYASKFILPGSGAGGGASSNTGNAQAGAKGGDFGGGGGGGGAATDAVGNSGAGGNGGQSGLVIIERLGTVIGA